MQNKNSNVQPTSESLPIGNAMLAGRCFTIHNKMTDKQWQSVINKCRKAGDKHLRLLQIAEQEYERRYGNHPSEVDDDWWIDTLHYCKGDTDLEKIKQSAELRNDR